MAYAFGGLIGLFCVGILLLVFGGGGVFLIYKYFKLRQQSTASQTWPGTAGQVVEVKVDRSRHTDSDDDTYYTYAPNVTYTYQVGGQSFTGMSLTFGIRESHRNQAKAQAVAARYSPGQQVAVFYNPAKPEEAALERRTSGTTASLIVGIALLAVGGCLCCPMTWMIYSQATSLLGGSGF